MYAGETALIHCLSDLSGRHRAGLGGCVFRALLALAYVKSCRKTLDIPVIIGEEGMRPWVDAAIRTSTLSNPLPAPCGYIATARSKVHLELQNGQALCSHKRSQERAARLVQPMRAKDMRELGVVLFVIIVWCEQQRAGFPVETSQGRTMKSLGAHSADFGRLTAFVHSLPVCQRLHCGLTNCEDLRGKQPSDHTSWRDEFYRLMLSNLAGQ